MSLVEVGCLEAALDDANETIIKLETALYDVLGATTLAKAKIIADKALPIERVQPRLNQ